MVSIVVRRPSNDEEALRKAVERNHDVVEKYLRRRLSRLPPSDLDDLVDETFVIVWRRLKSMPPPPEDRAWTVAVARNVLRNAQRSSRRRLLRLGFPVELQPIEPRSPSAEDVALTGISAQEAFAKLAAQDQEALTLHFWEGLDISELAAVLGLSYGAASVRLSRARVRFLEMLETEDGR